MSTLLLIAAIAMAPPPATAPVEPAMSLEERLASLKVESKKVCSEMEGTGSRLGSQRCRKRYYGADGEIISSKEAKRRQEEAKRLKAEAKSAAVD